MTLIDGFTQFAVAGGSGSEPLGGAAFVRQGEYWTVAFAGEMVLLRDSKGLHYLAELLRRAGHKVSVAVLANDASNLTQITDGPGLERARSAVTKRIRDALQKIEKNHPALGKHLGARVKTGYECMYMPDPDQPIAWQL